MMSSETGFDFASQIDCCGGVMWLWHKKMTAENGGLTLIKDATKEFSVADLPANWPDHIEVVQKKRTKVRVRRRCPNDMDPFEVWRRAARSFPWTPRTRPRSRPSCVRGSPRFGSADHHLLQTHTCTLQESDGRPRPKLKLVGFSRQAAKARTGAAQLLPLSPAQRGLEGLSLLARHQRGRHLESGRRRLDHLLFQSHARPDHGVQGPRRLGRPG